MTIFRRKLRTGNENVKFTGVHLPLELNSYLVLFTTASDTSKSKIIENELENWKTSMQKKMSIQELVDVLIEKALITFNNSDKRTLSHFLNELEQELLKKGVTLKVVIQIKNGVKNGAVK